VTYGTTYDIWIIIYIDKFHSKLVYVGLAQARPNMPNLVTCTCDIAAVILR